MNYHYKKRKTILDIEWGGNIYVIVTYDVQSEKCVSLMKLLRKYLFHIQHSVFEGELTSQMKNKLVNDIHKIIKKEDGNVIIYVLPSEKPLNKVTIGNTSPMCKTII